MYGTDYMGRVCGVDAGTAGKYITYPRINDDFLANFGKSPVNYKFYGVCAASCPTFSFNVSTLASTKIPIVCNDAGAPFISTQTSNDTALACLLPGNTDNACYATQANCWLMPLPTASTMFRCIPQYSSMSDASSTCVFPASITSSSDPNCLLVAQSAASTVVKPAKPNQLFDQLDSLEYVWARYLGDLGRAWWVVLLCAVGVALAAGFLFTTFIKYFTGCMVWSIIWLTLLLLSFLCGFFYYKAGMVSSSITSSLSAATAAIPGATAVTSYSSALSGTASSMLGSSYITQTTGPGSVYAIIAYTCTAVLLIVLCMVLALRASIRTAIEVVRLGSEALKGTPSLLVFPVTTTLTLGVFMVWWCFVTACLATSGDALTTANLATDMAAGAAAVNAAASAAGAPAITALSLPGSNATMTSISGASSNLKYVLIYHFFGLLWTTAFIGGVALTTMAGAISGWYFSQLPAEAEAVPALAKLKYSRGACPVASSLGRTLRYHLGSVAVGSFLIALVQLARAAMAYVANQLKAAAKGNSWLAFALCCANCCLSCLDCCIQVVTKNAYIYVALKGEGFLASGRRVFSLITQHGAVFAVVNVLGVLIVTLGKVLIAVISAFVAYLIVENYAIFQAGGAQQLSSSWLVILVTLFFGYATGSAFMSVFDVAVDTVLVCYVTDCDENMARNGGDSAFAVPVHFKKVRREKWRSACACAPFQPHSLTITKHTRAHTHYAGQAVFKDPGRKRAPKEGGGGCGGGHWRAQGGHGRLAGPHLRGLSTGSPAHTLSS